MRSFVDSSLVSRQMIETQKALHQLLEDVKTYEIMHGVYRPPIIDWFHPNECRQNAISGFHKFYEQVKQETSYVDTMVAYGEPPLALSTNLISLQSIWDAFLRSDGPKLAISYTFDRQSPLPTKVDVIAEGGNVWVKVNTIKESRFMAELHEQDSYVNSDYSDSNNRRPKRPLTNSIIKHAKVLLRTARLAHRPPGLPPPIIRYVFARLDPDPSSYEDQRIPATFDILRAMGVEVQFAKQWAEETTKPKITQRPEIMPVRDLVLDLSVLVALCCDAAHHPLPVTDDELEARYRPLRRVQGGRLELEPHSNISKDLRDQLRCEMSRPLILELRERLSMCMGPDTQPRFWVTREVKERLPSIIDVIGGDYERARARSLFDPSSGNSFWKGSRWVGATGALEDIHIRVLEDSLDAPQPCAPSTTFDYVVTRVCQAMLASSDDGSTGSPPLEKCPSASTAGPKSDAHSSRGSGKSLKTSKPGTASPSTQRLPSNHTVRTLLAGIERGATVLTNNRGAMLKVAREAGVFEGIPTEKVEPGRAERARIWVVNPSSLAEWRRLKVEASNKVVREETVDDEQSTLGVPSAAIVA